MTRLFVIRHAETQWTVEDRMCGSADPPLTVRGNHMAEAIGQRLADLPFAAIYTSPTRRCRATAAAIAQYQPAPTHAGHAFAHGAVGLAAPPPVPHVIDDLREYDFGAWEGMARSDLHRDPRYVAWAADPLDTPAPGGDVARAVARRAQVALAALVAAHGGEDIAIVSHKTIIRLLLCAWSGAPLSAYRSLFRQDACALNIIYIGAAGAVRFDLLNDTAHLHDLWRTPLNR